MHDFDLSYMDYICICFIKFEGVTQYPRPECTQNPDFYQTQVNAVNRLVNGNELECHDQLRVIGHTFFRLCCLVRSVGLGDSRYVILEERVAIFLWILAHHTKQRRTKHQFWRSTETISRHFNAVLQAVLRLHRMLLVTPDPVPANYHDNRWSWFQVHLCSTMILAIPFCFLNSTLCNNTIWNFRRIVLGLWMGHMCQFTPRQLIGHDIGRGRVKLRQMF